MPKTTAKRGPTKSEPSAPASEYPVAEPLVVFSPAGPPPAAKPAPEQEDGGRPDQRAQRPGDQEPTENS